MAVLVILELPGTTTAHYEKVNEVLGVLSEADAPEGLISRSAGVTGDGLLIVDLWESEAAAAAFFARGIDETMAPAGAPAPPGPPRMLQVHHVAALKENGDVLVIDIWPSAEAFGDFAQKQIALAGQDVGMAPFEPRFVPIHNRLRGASLVS